MAAFAVCTASAEDGSADFQRIFDSYPKYKAATQKLEAEKKQRESQLAAQLKSVSSEAERKVLIQDADEWFKQRQLELVAPAVDEARQAIIDVAKDKNLDQVHNSAKSIVVNDITPDVIARLNTQPQAAVPVKLQKLKTAGDTAQLDASDIDKIESAPSEIVQPLPLNSTAVNETQSVQKDTPQKASETAKPAVKISADKAAAGRKITIQFCADSSSEYIKSLVAKVKKSGINSAHVVKKQVKGQTWWCAQVSAADAQEAKKISSKLQSLGFNTFTVSGAAQNITGKDSETKIKQPAADIEAGKSDAASAFIVHFGADTEAKDITRYINKARNSGIDSACVVKKTNDKGVVWWYAQAAATNAQEAHRIAAKIRSLGMNSYITAQPRD